MIVFAGHRRVSKPMRTQLGFETYQESFLLENSSKRIMERPENSGPKKYFWITWRLCTVKYQHLLVF